MAWTNVAKMFSDMHKMDTIYTVVALAAQSTGFCSYLDISISWTLYAICATAGIVSIIVRGIIAYNHFPKSKKILMLLSVGAICVFLCIALPLYLLTDNEQPFDCLFGCDLFATSFNVTGIEDAQISCQMAASSGTRFALMSIVGILVSCATVLYFVILAIDKKKDAYIP